ncbi:MAG TPA: CinA family protein [Noviherbaspirillum sp.]|uniref:CinA family protein n=1 Tax=Noviherbaspirillum sp. TaxID=1926288 RepID=UPI002D312A24|nr:CinA family protein [Noviherbaspirillum sp.]HYD95052.1 CinA family protein [Noviherbaspirillum sp.]
MDNIIELAARVGQALKEKGLLLATAESCTGGGVAQAVTEIAGSSAWFERGFVTYSNAAKTELLDVPAALIERHGAVSEEVAAAMALGALGNSRAQLALSTTGIAGPGGAVPGKPVGTVCFGWARADSARTERLVFAGDRRLVREQTVAHALRGVLLFLEEA